MEICVCKLKHLTPGSANEYFNPTLVDKTYFALVRQKRVRGFTLAHISEVKSHGSS